MKTSSRTIRISVFALLTIVLSLSSQAQEIETPDHPLFQGDVHEVPPLLFDQEHVRVALRFEPESGRIFGVLKLRVRPSSDTLNTLSLDATPLDIYGVQIGPLDSVKVDAQYADSAGAFNIALDSLQVRGVPFEVQITYSTAPESGMHFRKIDPADTTYAVHIWTDTSPGSLRHWLPLINNPADRVTSEIIATVPHALSAISNGRLVESMTTEDDMELYHYVQDQPHAPNHIGLVIGHFQKVQDNVPLPNGASLPFNIWTPAYGLERAPSSFEDVAGIIGYFSDKLDFAYPWPSYTQVIYDGLLQQNLSYTGLNLISDRILKDDRALIDEPGTLELASLIARQWSGHLLSVDFWSETWMTEGLSHFLGMLYLRDTAGDAVYFDELSKLRDAYLREAQYYQRPLVWNQWDTPLSLQDAHALAKGAWFYHSIYQHIGEDAFWSVLRDFFSQKAFQTSNTDELLAAVNRNTEDSFSRFFDNGVYSAGHPVIQMNYQHDLVAESLYVSIEQVQEGYLVPPVYSTDFTLETYSLTGPSHHTVAVTRDDELIALPMSIKPRYVLLDPDRVFLAQKEIDQPASAWITQLRYASNPLSQLEAIEHLYDFADDPALLIGLQSALSSRPSPQIRAGIIELIAALPPSDATKKTILSAFEDNDPFVQRTVLRSLEGFEDRSDLHIIAMEAAQSAESYLLQAQAVETLVRTEAPSAKDIVESALITPSHRDIVRQTAIKSLTYLKMSTQDRVRKVKALTEARHSTEVRIAAIQDLGELASLQNRTSLAALITLLDDKDPLIRRAAIQALGSTMSEGASEALTKHRDLEKDIIVLHDINSALRQITRQLENSTSS